MPLVPRGQTSVRSRRCTTNPIHPSYPAPFRAAPILTNLMLINPPGRRRLRTSSQLRRGLHPMLRSCRRRPVPHLQRVTQQRVHLEVCQLQVMTSSSQIQSKPTIPSYPIPPSHTPNHLLYRTPHPSAHQARRVRVYRMGSGEGTTSRRVGLRCRATPSPSPCSLWQRRCCHSQLVRALPRPFHTSKLPLSALERAEERLFGATAPTLFSPSSNSGNNTPLPARRHR